MAFDNVVDPTSCNPYTTASGDRKRACPKANLVDIQAKILRSLMLSFTFSNPQDNYKVLLYEGSDEIWEIDYVKDGELQRAAGKVAGFECWSNKHVALSTYRANGIKERDEKIVVRFDCSMDYKNKVVAIDVRNIRRLKLAGSISDSELTQDSENKFYKTSKNAYNFLRNLYPKTYMDITELDKELNTDLMEYADHMFDGGTSLLRLPPINLTNTVSADYMFKDNENLQSVVLSNSDKLASAAGMFENCRKLNNVELNTKSVQSGENMFKNCNSLVALKLNVNSLTNTKNMFLGCRSLTKLQVTGELKTGLDLTKCPLDENSVASVLNALSNNGPDESQLISFEPRDVNATLLPIAQAAEAAGWTIRGLNFVGDKLEEELSIDLLESYKRGKSEG